MRSSYKDNNYADFFTAFIKIHQPQLVVECGILDGYSLIAMAKGLPEGGRAIGIDLFDDYEFKHGTLDAVSSAIWDEGMSQRVDLIRADALVVADTFVDDSVDILHVDISNDGDILAKMFNKWYHKIKEGGYFIFEGGSEPRDNVEWMTKYNKPKIGVFKLLLQQIPGLEVLTLEPFPSLTICHIKKKALKR